MEEAADLGDGEEAQVVVGRRPGLVGRFDRGVASRQREKVKSLE